MCGIAGLWDFSLPTVDDLSRNVISMTASIFHRGPDAGAHWTDAENGIALGHRRLSIIDLSENGIQPMTSADGKWVIVYNGEIYNHGQLSKALIAEGASFRGHSDTEVLLEGVARWGIGKTIEQAIGMFAFALWNRQEKYLTLGRDRLGIKPLYWSFKNDRLLFGSELKALKAHPNFEKVLDLNALAGFFRHNYIPAPLTVFQGVSKLEPGTLLTLQRNGKILKEQFWSLKDVICDAKKNPFEGSDEEAVDQLEALLTDAVSKRMIADVPLGAFLSGGIDSSTVTALMQAQSTRPVRTFSIGFHIEGYNEADHAKAVAKHLKTDHTELYVSGEEARNVIPKLAHMYDEPFADSSQIPTFLVSEMTRKHVTVALSGDGGDELWAGYTRYVATERLANKIFAIPSPIRRIGADVLSSFPTGFWEAMRKISPSSLKFSNPANKAAKVAAVLRGSKSELYRTLISHWDCPEALVLGARENPGPAWDASFERFLPDDVERMQYIDTLTYLPDDILTKVDRASMAVALEVRVPMIDHRVVSFAWSLPKHYKIRDGQSKWLLRQVLFRHVPQSLIDRPKMGFGIPLGTWLRGPLKEWACELLDEKKLKRQGIFNVGSIDEKWQQHLSGRCDWGYHLWDVLMFQAWHDEWMDHS